MAKLHSRIGTFRQLEILLAVYQTGSITAASKKLFLTQPTVSMQLKKLSDAVGVPIYNHVGRKLVFTQAGLEVINSARDVLNGIERLEMKLSDIQGLKAGTLRLAVVTTAKYFIPHLLGEFLKLYPDIDINFKVGNRQQIMDRLATGEDDFYVFNHPPESSTLHLHEFLPNPLVAIAQKNHPLANEKSIPLEIFADQPFLIREAGSGTRHAIEQHFSQHGIIPNVRMTIESNEAIKHAVMSGLGVSILSSHTLAFGGSGGLVVLDVQQLPITTKWYLANLQVKKLSVVAHTFFEYITAYERESMLSQMQEKYK
ncbi:LysR family transcriptional regulator [Neptunomonas japonica]|uniref:LysR family transcriptional regulator n=1 Tax=Neptunomonas japonica JAMM 1380 TaxID=1441457 RepID=A0A7R6PEG4_9GAMM|nr:LysR family transcriptional regulator [Neptunomonas japonica]BBB27968.1 LysR family transcriptional regulator [Neptunomonas japonica JAMM 1380]